MRYAMAAFRFIAVVLLSFFLLSPLVKTTSRDVEKPVIIFVQDNSASVLINKDSAYYKNQYRKDVSVLITALSEKYDTNTYVFSSDVKSGLKIDFSGKQTDMSALMDELETRFSNRNVGAVIFASDGLYNKGTNPVYSLTKIKAPFYTIALSDTAIKRDLLVKKVAHNRYAFLGNSFPLEIVVNANKLKSEKTILSVAKGGQNLFSQAVTINTDNYFLTVPVMLDAKQPGLQRYTISLTDVKGEVSYVNNKQDVFIEVLDSRQKILILANAPHPDVAAIKETIEKNQNYIVESYLASDFNKRFTGYNLIILHQLPSSSAASQVADDALKSNVPVLFIIGSQTSLNQFNNLKSGLSISAASRGQTNDALASVSPNFTLFTLNEKLKSFIPKCPPLQSPFGNFSTANSANVLLYQKIGSVATQNPLLLYNEDAIKKCAVIAGEGIWKWKLLDYAEHGNNDLFDELISKTVQYLSVKIDKSLFRVKCNNKFFEDDAIEFDAEFYNESYEPINDPEVSLTIINDEKKSYPFTFSKTANAYRLNAGSFPVGNYKYDAKVKSGNKVYSAKGEFSVSAMQIESTNTTADHQLLFSMAKKSGGEMVYPANMSKLAEMINAREDVKPISYMHKNLDDLINLKYIFFLLLALLSAEWFLRKWSGGY